MGIILNMEKTQLGRTNLMVTRTSFGVLPLQRVNFETARRILRRAYDAGINFYDTASAYTDSEEKIGYSLSDVRPIAASRRNQTVGANWIRNII